MDPFVSQKVKELLIAKHGICVYKIIGTYCASLRLYMAHIYFKTDAELCALTAEKKEEIRSIYIGYLKERGYMPDEIEKTIFYFDSDENVQKNYAGNYFYATR